MDEDGNLTPTPAHTDGDSLMREDLTPPRSNQSPQLKPRNFGEDSLKNLQSLLATSKQPKVDVPKFRTANELHELDILYDSTYALRVRVFIWLMFPLVEPTECSLFLDQIQKILSEQK
jgi:hypothetical protein